MEENRDSLYTVPSVYDMLFRERTHDLAFYERVVRDYGGPTLEIGVGSGRVAEHLAKAGHRVVGIDRSRDMIDQARRRLEREGLDAELLEGSLAESLARLGRRFRTVLCPFNGIAHCVDDRSLHDFLSGVRTLLVEGGIFAFDTLKADPARIEGYESSIPWMRHPDTSEVCRADERVSFDREARLVKVELELRSMQREGVQQNLCLTLRQFTPLEINDALREHAFVLREPMRDLGDTNAWIVGISN